jgi:hypothetical protein
MAQPRDEMQELSRDLIKLRDDLRGIADEVRLKIHLAGMEAKDAWKRAEPRLVDFEQRAERAAETTAVELRELAQDLKTSLKKIRDAV